MDKVEILEKQIQKLQNRIKVLESGKNNDTENYLNFTVDDIIYPDNVKKFEWTDEDIIKSINQKNGNIINIDMFKGLYKPKTTSKSIELPNNTINKIEEMLNNSLIIYNFKSESVNGYCHSVNKITLNICDQNKKSIRLISNRIIK